MKSSEISTEALVQEALQGSRSAMEEVLRRIQDRVYALALRMRFHLADAEDATQEILIKVMTNLKDFRFEGPFQAWVYRIASNHLKTLRKRRTKRLQLNIKKAQAIIDRAEARGWFAQPCDAPEPFLEVELRSACTQALLQALNRPHRLAFILGAIIEVTSTEGAYILGISPAAFRKRLSRARAQVKDFLTANCGYFEDTNRCNCASILTAHTEQGWIDPQKPIFVSADDPVQDPLILKQYLKELDELGRISALFKSLPRQKSALNVVEMVKQMVEKKNYRIL